MGEEANDKISFSRPNSFFTFPASAKASPLLKLRLIFSLEIGVMTGAENFRFLPWFLTLFVLLDGSGCNDGICEEDLSWEECIRSIRRLNIISLNFEKKGIYVYIQRPIKKLKKIKFSMNQFQKSHSVL